jgi:hypothetical protein
MEMQDQILRIEEKVQQLLKEYNHKLHKLRNFTKK